MSRNLHVGLLMLFLSGRAWAAAPASDNASEGAYSAGWANGSNGGSGWGGGWTLSPITNLSQRGFFVGNSAGNDGGDPGGNGDINTTGSKAWGIYANSGQTADVIRQFYGALHIGDTFTVDFDNGWINSGNSVGLGLRDAGNTNRFEFYFAGGDSVYRINDNSSASRSTGIGWTGQGLRLAFTLTGTNTYSLTVSGVGTDGPGGLPTTITGTLTGTVNSAIDRFRFWNYSAGSGSQYDAFFNSLSVTCSNAPAITNQPSDLVVCTNSPATFTVGATGDNLAYQWRKGATGFGGWILETSVSSSASNGFFIGSSTNNGATPPSGGIDTSGKAFGLYANTGASANAYRYFTAGSLVSNQTFTIEMDNGTVQTGGTVGLGLQNGDGDNLWELFFTGGDTVYKLIDNAGTRATTIGWTPSGLRVAWTLTATNTYSVTLTRLSDSASQTLTGTLLNPAGGRAVELLRLYNVNAGTGAGADLFFNNLDLGYCVATAAATVYADGWDDFDNEAQPMAGPTAWQLGGSGTRGFFVASSTGNASGDSNTDGDINVPRTPNDWAWGLYASGGGLAEAIRPFGGALSTGSVFQVEMDNGNIQTGGAVGLALQSNVGTNRFQLYFNGGDSNYTIADNSGTRNTGLAFTGEGVTVALTLTGTDTYSVTLTRKVNGVSTNLTGTLAGTAGTGIERLRLFNSNAGTLTAHDAFFNRLQWTTATGQRTDDAYHFVYDDDWQTGDDGGAPSSNSYTIASAQLSDDTCYEVIVGGRCPPAVTSRPAALQVQRDTDGDGLPDCWEIPNGLDPNNPSDATGDADGDGLTNAQEYAAGTNPQSSDTDSDGMSDLFELQYLLNPLSAADAGCKPLYW